MRHGRRADAALGADHGDDAAERLRAGGAEKLGDRLDEVHDLERRDKIFADAAGDQLAIERDVVGAAEHDDFGSRVAVLGKLVELAISVEGSAGASSTITLGVAALR